MAADALTGPDQDTLGSIVEVEFTGGGWNPKSPEKKVAFQFNPDAIQLQVDTTSAGGGPFAANQSGHQGGRRPSGGTSGANRGPQPHGGGSSTTGTKAPKLVLGNVYFDGGFTKSVAPQVMTLWDWMYPPKGSDQKKPVPQNPHVQFKLGKTNWAIGTLSGLVVKYTMFTRHGEPTRAEVTITITCDSSDVLPRQNPTSGGIAGYSATTLSAGDTLQSVAYATYGHPRLWRQLAAVNAIDDPLRVRPGTMIMLPTLSELLEAE